jgi:hypothetical protein
METNEKSTTYVLATDLAREGESRIPSSEESEAADEEIEGKDVQYVVVCEEDVPFLQPWRGLPKLCPELAIAECPSLKLFY